VAGRSVGDVVPIVGVSVGFRHEPTGLVVAEAHYVAEGEPYGWVSLLRGKDGRPVTENRRDVSTEYRVTYVKRLDPPTTAPKVTKAVEKVVDKLLANHTDIVLVGEMYAVGAAGWRAMVGQVVGERFGYGKGTHLAQGALRILNASQGGGLGEDKVRNVGRGEVIGVTQRLFDEHRLKISRPQRHSGPLLSDLTGLDPTRKRPPIPDADGGREWQNDDLAYALGCGLWVAEGHLGRKEHILIEPIRPLDGGSP
jgi:hypothetical protein